MSDPTTDLPNPEIHHSHRDVSGGWLRPTVFGAMDGLVSNFALVAGIMVSGFNSITSLSGTQVSASEGLGLVWLSLLFYLVPILAVASIGLLFSTVFRNSAAAIVGTLMFSLLVQLIGILPGLGGVRPYLLSTQFNAWQGFLRSPVDWTPVIRALWVCALYAVPARVSVAPESPFLLPQTAWLPRRAGASPSNA